MDAGLVDFLEDSVELDLKFVLFGSFTLPAVGLGFQCEFGPPGLGEYVDCSCGHTCEVSGVSAGILAAGQQTDDVKEN